MSKSSVLLFQLQASKQSQHDWLNIKL